MKSEMRRDREGRQRKKYPECSPISWLSIDAKLSIQKYKDICVMLHSRGLDAFFSHIVKSC